jgi:3-(methylthio)propanoyl-CoA dehydrogenase
VIPYNAPIADMRFALREVADLEDIARLPGCETAEPELIDAVLEEAAKFAANRFAPLNRPGDIVGSRIENGVVRTPDGFKEAYAAFVDGGWNALPFAPEIGGQGLPRTVATAVTEMWHAANMAFGLCPLLTASAVEVLSEHGGEELKARYLPHLVSGRWTGTMCLTEPHAGSDLSHLRTRAEPEDGHFRLRGTKIYITWGEHDLTENIIHLVLARTPDAPPGTRGLSLFLVPKFLADDNGRPGRRNDLRCVSLEHKLGIRASPTCVLAFGEEEEGAIGYLVGERHCGLPAMFTMMNHARIAVGLEGLAIAERAYQQAVAYARERRQGRAPGSRDPEPVPIIRHPDIRRMLLTMRAQIEAMRALIYATAAAADRARHHPEAEERHRQHRRVELLTPVVKAWCSDLGFEIASLGVQVHGGMGYVEETGAAQHLRDARIAMIYEGTNGIQALDLAGRKLAMDEGRPVRELLEELERSPRRLAETGEADADLRALAEPLRRAVGALRSATEWLQTAGAADPLAAPAAATPYLRLFGLVAGGELLAREALAAHRRLAENRGSEDRLCRAKLATARFYAEQLLPQAEALGAAVSAGAGALSDFDEGAF